MSARSAGVKVAAVAGVALYLAAGHPGHPHHHHPGKPPRHASEAIAYAYAQIGKPYQWGGTGPATFDCSGLTMRAEEAAGVDSPRTSEQQWAAFPHVRHPRAGDLAFFAGVGDPPPGHVAIFVGHGYVIDAPHTGAFVRRERISGIPGFLGFASPSAVR
jgi:cell wall-associated NlpC family hydrolase